MCLFMKKIKKPQNPYQLTPFYGIWLTTQKVPIHSVIYGQVCFQKYVLQGASLHAVAGKTITDNNLSVNINFGLKWLASQ